MNTFCNNWKTHRALSKSKPLRTIHLDRLMTESRMNWFFMHGTRLSPTSASGLCTQGGTEDGCVHSWMCRCVYRWVRKGLFYFMTTWRCPILSLALPLDVLSTYVPLCILWGVCVGPSLLGGHSQSGPDWMDGNTFYTLSSSIVGGWLFFFYYFLCNSCLIILNDLYNCAWHSPFDAEY